MCSTTVDAAASSPPWTDLPLDILCDVSRHLHLPTDYVRFHAVCNPWRDTFLPATTCSSSWLLPWLVSSKAKGRRKARCVFSSVSTEIFIPDRRWAIRTVDGCLFLPSSVSSDDLAVSDPLTAGSPVSIALPPYPDEMKPWAKHAAGVVTSDGTIFLYAFFKEALLCFFNAPVPVFAAILRPGATAWVLVKCGDTDDTQSCCIAYHDSKIVQCQEGSSTGCQWKMLSPDQQAVISSGYLEVAAKVRSSYLVESRRQLLWVFVLEKIESTCCKNASKLEHRAGDLGSLPNTLSLSVYALRDDGCEPLWVEKDGQSLADRVFFLGRKGSFAAEASLFGMSGCAYFVDTRPLYCQIWNKCPQEMPSVQIQFPGRHGGAGGAAASPMGRHGLHVGYAPTCHCIDRGNQRKAWAITLKYSIYNDSCLMPRFMGATYHGDSYCLL
ncbi:hypothetical protein EJB05_36901, partial [Eragrostis curvula]